MSKKVLILDGDSISFKCASAGEQRSIEVTHQPTNTKKSFKHRTEFKNHMEDRGKQITSDYLIEDKQEPEPIAFVLSTIKNHINRIVKEVQPDELVIFAGEQDNFRTKLFLPKQYKGQRVGSVRPVHLKEAKSYIRSKYDAKEAIGYEVDDACCIAAYDTLRAGDTPIMLFCDKDQYQLDGVTLLYDNNEFDYQIVPVLGELRLEKTSVKGLGLKFLAYQWICSDPVDNYCAYDLSSVRFGSKSAYNVLVGCKTEQEVLIIVREQFKKFYPEPFEYKDWNGVDCKGDWLSMLKMYYKCCRMMRSQDDKLDCLELFNQYGVEL